MQRRRLIFLPLAAALARPASAWAQGAGRPPPVSGTAIAQAARQQIGVTLRYSGAYEKLAYPNGDVPRERGVCTDVVIRALRDAGWGDLQRLVHEDMRANFSAYPRIWGLKQTDRNIDHRRVPNLRVYFARKSWSLRVQSDAARYQPGDLVTTVLPGNLPHIMVVSDRKTAQGMPLVIHNIGRGTQEEDGLFSFAPDGHYRLAKS
ncbi:MAG: DUF1287 domain-containing protein [Burkholderiaceae bacterium]|jgi:uncharacterized protein YijF (DUF1287 family)|nr:DUF1287 domain-containing protein [Burkholderiaceae bacterium]